VTAPLLWIDDDLQSIREGASELEAMLACKWHFAVDFQTAAAKLESTAFRVIVSDNSFRFGFTGLSRLGLSESENAGEIFIEALARGRFNGRSNSLKLIILYTGDESVPVQLLELDSRIRFVRKPGLADLLNLLEAVIPIRY
jgi:hypothetical protein